MKKLVKIIPKYLPQLILALILLIIFVANYTPNTYLAGWDNLMPELNIWMNIKRSMVAVWQEYQGLGLVGGMAHASDLVRQLLILPFTFILPQYLIRYLWHFGMLCLGSFGVFCFLKNILKFNPKVSLLGGLFYLLNFGTIQYFWAPFEPFSTFWGFFPWLIYVFNETIEYPNRKNFIRLALVNLLAVPSYYTQATFVVYILSLLPYIFAEFICNWKNIRIYCSSKFLFGENYLKNFSPISENRSKNKIFIIIFSALSIIILVNSFWLLPQLYFIKTNLFNTTQSQVNQIVSEQTFMRNQERGTVSDFLLLRGYYYDYFDGTDHLMEPWQDYFANPIILAIGYFLSGIILFGLFYTIFFNKQLINKKYRLALLGLFLLISIALLSATIPFSWLNWLLRQSGFLNQLFRSPFTKFLPPASFIFAIFFAIGIETIVKLLNRMTKLIIYPVYLIAFILIIIFAWPVFKGNFIYSKMRVAIPNEYTQLIEYLKKQPKDARVMNLPQGNYYGWTFYRWGMRGSGFLWYGIEQPILDRAFDVWNLKNEQYYWELNFALQKQDLQLLNNILQKYSIQYILFDDNIYFPGEKEYARQSVQTKTLLEQATFLKPVARFGQITIYQTNWQTKPTISLSKLTSIYPFSYTNNDLAFSQYNNYLINDTADIYYPFIDLFSNRFQSDNPVTIKDNDQTVAFESSLPSQINSNFQINGLNLLNSKMQIVREKDKISAHLDYSQLIKDRDYYLLDKPEMADFKNCNPTLTGPTDREIYIDNGNSFVRLSATNGDICYNWYLNGVSHNQSWIVEIEYRYQTGYPLLVSAIDGNSQLKFFDTKLDKNPGWQKAYFIIPDNNSPTNGLAITIDNPSFNQSLSQNDIKSVKVFPIPLSKLQEIKLEKTGTVNLKTNDQTINTNNYLWFYNVSLNNQSMAKNLILPQSYDNGWIAFGKINGKYQLLPHNLINNWENGWNINGVSENVIVIFWPQLLEFLGFGFLLITFGYLIFLQKNSSN